MIGRFLHWMLLNGSYVMIISLGVAVVRRRFLQAELRYIVDFLLLSLVGEVVSLILSKLHIPNLFLLHIYTLIEFNIIALFYRRFFSNFYPKWLIIVLLTVFNSFAVFNTLFLQPLTVFNTYARGLESLMVIGLSILCFYKMLTELDIKRPETNPVFWINTGFLIYFAGSLILFILANVAIAQPNQSLSLMSWGLHSCLFVLMHLAFGLGLWLSPNLR
ncbi:hypothetical protein [Spirosoma oryzicola]|uniref:hypothetical protein n=1 Tax=Spirosoma oryzicola TaxID=2898794 RepID=UPI001E4341F9|nr:hypothetical protein [Spirosoma oryzicola]UHG93775.1 hypothetical protein LQ777_24965 [Spirosoma oryzicola]